ncbi:MAG: hypothetical protein J6U52_04830, partial [Alistipes sp.]|nr:hypothetical protein [Alistipes sp.]
IWMIEDGIGYCAPLSVAPLNACPLCLPQGSNGEAEARISLKINIFLSSQPTTTLPLTNKSRAQKARFWWRSFRLLADGNRIQQKNAR